MAEWIAFLSLAALAFMALTATLSAMFFGAVFARDWEWLFPVFVFGLLAALLGLAAVSIAPHSLMAAARALTHG